MTTPRSQRMYVRRTAVPLLAAAMLFTACSEPTTEPEFSRSGDLAELIGDLGGTPDDLRAGIVLACAFAENRPETMFTSSATGGELINAPTGAFSIPVGLPECIEIWNATGDGVEQITVTLESAAGHMIERIVRVGELAGEPVTLIGTNTVTVPANSAYGAMVWFKLLPADEPPPPTGGEGCTPGYWKQSQHFDSWTGYSPNQLFSSVFENAFPNMTLVQVLSQGGGGLKALGRHTVAALLNASSPGVSADHASAADVIAEFNGAHPGDKDAYEALKNRYEMFNEQGCPLN